MAFLKTFSQLLSLKFCSPFIFLNLYHINCLIQKTKMIKDLLILEYQTIPTFNKDL